MCQGHVASIVSSRISVFNSFSSPFSLSDLAPELNLWLNELSRVLMQHHGIYPAFSPFPPSLWLPAQQPQIHLRDCRISKIYKKHCTFPMLLLGARINQVSPAHYNTIQENFVCLPPRCLWKHFARQCTKYERRSKSSGRWSSQPAFSHSAHRVFCCYKCLYIERGPILHWNLLQWTHNPEFPIYSTNE